MYKRYASLYFLTAIDPDDNELVTLDMIHQFVEVLDKHFSNVCELDLVFHFYKAYWLMDEVFLAGVPDSHFFLAASRLVEANYTSTHLRLGLLCRRCR